MLEFVDFTEVDELAARMRSLRSLNDGELRRLREEFAVENTYHSNAVEGSSLTLRETALILQAGITIGEKPLREHLDAVGHREAFAYVMELADRDSPLTEATIRNIHALVLMWDRQNRGVYRGVPVTISGAAHTLPQSYLVPVRMERLLSDYAVMKTQAHILWTAAWFHREFELIHPFLDGNGRTGRLILNLELVESGLLPVHIKFTDRRRYYDCFADSGPDSLARLLAEYETEELKRRIDILSPPPPDVLSDKNQTDTPS